MSASQSNISHNFGNTVIGLIDSQSKQSVKYSQMKKPKQHTSSGQMNKTSQMQKDFSTLDRSLAGVCQNYNVLNTKAYPHLQRQTSISKSGKPTIVHAKRESAGGLYFKRRQKLETQKSEIKDKENLEKPYSQKKNSAITTKYKKGMRTKTMSDLSAKGPKNNRNILATINKELKRTPNYSHNSEQGKIRRYTPMEHHSTNDAIKNRVMRGAYSSTRKKDSSSDSWYEHKSEYNQGTREPSGGMAAETDEIVLKLEMESNKKDSHNEYYAETQKHFVYDEPMKLNKVPEEDSFWLESLNNCSTDSFDTCSNSVREIRKDSDTVRSTFLGSANGVNTRKISKQSSKNALLKTVNRFLNAPSYLWKCKDDSYFKWCETASKWILLAENASSKEFLAKDYFEAEYNLLLKEIYMTIPGGITLPKEKAVDKHEKEAQEVEANKAQWANMHKIQILKDLNRSFVGSPIFGKGTKGRRNLMDVLEVIALKYTGIGYVQGMNFLVAGFLYHCSPAVTLGLVSHLFENLQLCDVFAEDLVGVHLHNERLVQLVEKHLPEFNQFMIDFDIRLEIYSTQWIITLFSQVIPLEEYYLFFDSFLRHGWDFFYRLVLTVLEKLASNIMVMEDWQEIIEGIKVEISQTKWKEAIRDANYKFNKL